MVWLQYFKMTKLWDYTIMKYLKCEIAKLWGFQVKIKLLAIKAYKYFKMFGVDQKNI